MNSNNWSDYSKYLPLEWSYTPDPTTSDFVGLTTDNKLAFFNQDDLSSVSTVRINGLNEGTSLVGIDFRPNTGELFGVSSDSRIYTIDVTTGYVTQVGTAPLAAALNGTSFGFDFNPTVDRIRLVSDAAQNLRLNPNNGAVVDADPATPGLQVDGDLNGGTNSIVASAYTNNFSGTTTTVLYGIDSYTDQLFIQNPPNAGTQVLVGDLGVDFGSDVGFDIVTQYGIDTAFATSGSSLYTIDLTTGAAYLLGEIGDACAYDAFDFTGLAARSPVVKPEPAMAQFVGLTADSDLVFFNSNGANFNGLNNLTKVDVTGLEYGESLVGIDFRPATGELFGVGSFDRLYKIDVTTGYATQVGNEFVLDLDGDYFGFDFNPTVDRIRLVSDAGQNLRINPDTGAIVDADILTAGVQADGNLNGATTSIVASAYTNNFAGATSTILYGIDADTDQLFIQNPPNAGTQNLVGSLGVDIAPDAGFDIVTMNGVDMGFVTSGSSFYSINLNTGAASLLGTIQDVNQPIGLIGFAAAIV
jgi:3D (Asp-Asp-Asp) domain-containing protein